MAAHSQGETWFHRLQANGLEIIDLARLMGRSASSTRTLILKGDVPLPHTMVAVITAWEIMEPAQRDQWLGAAERETD